MELLALPTIQVSLWRFSNSPIHNDTTYFFYFIFSEIVAYA